MTERRGKWKGCRNRKDNNTWADACLRLFGQLLPTTRTSNPFSVTQASPFSPLIILWSSKKERALANPMHWMSSQGLDQHPQAHGLEFTKIPTAPSFSSWVSVSYIPPWIWNFPYSTKGAVVGQQQANVTAAIFLPPVVHFIHKAKIELKLGFQSLTWKSYTPTTA